MRFCTKCGSPVSGMLRFCTRCGAATVDPSTVGTGTVGTGTVGTGTAETGAAGPAAVVQDRAGSADTTTAAGIQGPGTRSAEAPAAPVIPGPPGSRPVIPAQTSVGEAESGGVPPDHTVPAPAAGPEPDQPAQGQPAPGQPPAGQPPAGQPTGMSGDAGPLRLVQIGAEPDHEAWPEDPWLPGSRRPDRRALIIGVVLIAGLLSVASTAWLARVNSPQASSPQGAHLSRPSQWGPGHAQPRQALSGQPTPILTQPGQPAPSQSQPSQYHPAQPIPAQPIPAQPACAHPDWPGLRWARPDRTQTDRTPPARTPSERQWPPGNQPERDRG